MANNHKYFDGEVFDFDGCMNDKLELFRDDIKGCFGRAVELTIREYLGRNSAVYRELSHIATQGKMDGSMTYKVDGKKKQVRYEIKTACGEIADISRSQFIIYCPEVSNVEDFSNLLEMFHVFTVAEFNEMLDNYPGKGSMTRINSRGYKQIQSFYSEGRPKASRKIRNYLDACCEAQPSLLDWERMLRG